MEEQQKKDLLKAIDELIEHYGRYELDEIPPSYDLIHDCSCPLCHYVDKHEPVHQRFICHICPWVTLENIRIPEGYVPCIQAGFAQHTTSQRLERLNRWKKLLMEKL
jgi:hypothetical protein